MMLIVKRIGHLLDHSSIQGQLYYSNFSCLEQMPEIVRNLGVVAKCLQKCRCSQDCLISNSMPQQHLGFEIDSFVKRSKQASPNNMWDMAKLKEREEQSISLRLQTSCERSCSLDGSCITSEDMIDDLDSGVNDRLEQGEMEYGCQHYHRRCRIRAPCCNEIFDCRHCHNEAKNSIDVEEKQRHNLPRHEVQRVICLLCNTEQEVHQVCVNCGVCMGKYFCEKCKLFDDDISKNQYHCNGCGICRTGGRENFFHCSTCGCCYSVLLKNSHPCIEGAMDHDCPVCFEYLFDSTNDVSVLPCGHTIHANCLKEMQQHLQYVCPLCSKSVCDMSKVWEKLDMEIAATPMPEPYQNKMVHILCNDCGAISDVHFHILAQKCLNCKSYNTRQL